MDNENPGYRTTPRLTPATSQASSTDENQYSTLLSVYNDLKEAMDHIDHWSAFDAKEEELSIKQQVVAYKKAYELVAPALDSVESALRLVNDKFKQR